MGLMLSVMNYKHIFDIYILQTYMITSTFKFIYQAYATEVTRREHQALALSMVWI